MAIYVRPEHRDFETYEADIKRLANGKYVVIAPNGRAVYGPTTEDDAVIYLYGEPEPPTCSLCDGVGHGYPGAGPCPLEERGWQEAEADRERYGSY